MNKRNREQARREKTKEKEEKRQQRATEKKLSPRGEGDEDPDLAGIVAGPQPIPEDF